MTDPIPTPPDGSFASDNAAGVSPEVLDALVEANSGPALAYGDDPWTRRAEVALRDLFDAPVEALFCWGGTGANVVALASVLQPWQAVLTTDAAHIVTDECGAPARFTGSTITPIAHRDGKLDPEALDPFLHWLSSEHHPQPAVVSISQATEMGTLYTVDEIAALADKAHANGMVLHVDGARIANAVVALGADVRTVIRDAGVDLMTFGLTKDGAMYGETVVFLRPELAERAAYVRKQAGQLLVEDAVHRSAGPGPARRRPVAPQRGPRQHDGGPAGRARERHPRRDHRSPARGQRAVPAGAGVGHRPPAGVVVLLGVGPGAVAGAVDDELCHHRGGPRALRCGRASHRATTPLICCTVAC